MHSVRSQNGSRSRRLFESDHSGPAKRSSHRDFNQVFLRAWRGGVKSRPQDEVGGERDHFGELRKLQNESPRAIVREECVSELLFNYLGSNLSMASRNSPISGVFW
jgi:hypothetical protein